MCRSYIETKGNCPFGLTCKFRHDELDDSVNKLLLTSATSQDTSLLAQTFPSAKSIPARGSDATDALLTPNKWLTMPKVQAALRQVEASTFRIANAASADNFLTALLASNANSDILVSRPSETGISYLASWYC